jgi:hypothetical protein
LEVAINDEQRNFFFDKKRKMEKTAYIRFNLSEKLISVERLSAIFSAVLTVFLICSSIALFSDGEFSKTVPGRAVSFIAIVTSVALLVVNLMDGAKGRPLAAAKMLKSGQGVLAIATSIEIELNSDDPNAETLKDHLEKYHELLDGLEVNHESSDNEFFERVEKLKSKYSWAVVIPWIGLQKLRLLNFVTSWWAYIAMFGICGFGFLLLFQRAASFFIAVP